MLARPLSIWHIQIVPVVFLWNLSACISIIFFSDDSDLNLVIDKDAGGFLKAVSMHKEGFGYIWAGARATFGFKSGKVCYEVKVCIILLIFFCYSYLYF